MRLIHTFLAGLLLAGSAIGQDAPPTTPQPQSQQPAATVEISANARRDIGDLTSLRKYPKACQNPAGCVPVIFIHGINGTKENPGEGECGLEPCGLASAVVPDCNWGPLFKYLATQPQTVAMWGEMDVYVFRYLSNQGLSVFDLAGQLNRSIQGAGITAPPILVAHSMGGLVARELMEMLMGPCAESTPCRFPDAVTGAITLATPHHGSPLANKRYRNWLAYRWAGNPFPAESSKEAVLRCGLEELAESYLASQVGLLNPLRQAVIKVGDLIDPGAREVCLFEIADLAYWGIEGNSRKAALDPLTPNRSDLLWDEYDDLFQEPILELEKSTPEWNLQLRRSMQSHAASRMFVYGGAILPPPGGWEKDLLPLFTQVLVASDPQLGRVMKLTAALMDTRLGWTLSSDGVVPLNSSLFLQNQNLAWLAAEICSTCSRAKSSITMR